MYRTRNNILPWLKRGRKVLSKTDSLSNTSRLHRAIKLTAFPWSTFFSYVFQSVPGHQWKQKILPQTHQVWLHILSSKQHIFHRAVSLFLFPLLLLFNEILIKISFNTQAKRQITLQSWDKMKLLTERMGGSNSHASIQKRKTSNFLSRHLQRGTLTFTQPVPLYDCWLESIGASVGGLASSIWHRG